MTQEEKQLLIRDLCARSPYGVKCKIRYTFNNETTFGEDVEAEEDDILVKIDPQSQSAYFDWYGDFISIENFKPYLRPLSSMTNEEKKEFDKIYKVIAVALDAPHEENEVTLEYAAISVFECDFYHSHHLDCCGLIEKGLALEAPANMYKI